MAVGGLRQGIGAFRLFITPLSGVQLLQDNYKSFRIHRDHAVKDSRNDTFMMLKPLAPTSSKRSGCSTR